MRRAALTLSLLAALPLFSCQCGPSQGPGEPPLGDGFERLEVVDGTTLLLRFSRPVDPDTVKPSAFFLASYTLVPPEVAEVEEAAVEGPDRVRITSSPLVPGLLYTLRVEGLKDLEGFAIEGTLNFTAVGDPVRLPFEVVISDVETARAHEGLTLLATVDPETGAFSERLRGYPVIDEGSRFVAVLEVLSDPNRTVDRADDADPLVDRRAYGVRLVDDAGRPASRLALFSLADEEAPRSLELEVLPPPEIVVPTDPTEPLPDPPTDDAPGDGVKLVRVVVDDRASRELTSPSLKLSFDENGAFDPSFPRTVPLEPLDGEEGYWNAVVGVRVDPNRVEDGSTEDTFPYFAFLVEGGVEYEALSVAITAPDETPQTVRLPLGNPEWTPVTFRVDVSRAYVTPDGSVRGHHPGEAIYLTGEWQQAVDALGNNCGDAFSGGEQRNLKMRELEGHPGVWTRTIWLPPGRPYGWKVVRCDAEDGCGPLNQLVASSGRAFATVMKNLVTDNVDAFADPNVGLIDPLAPEATVAGGQTFDYSGAVIYEGQGIGTEPDPSGTPDGQRMFKQEVPDLVVVVEGQPIKTRVFHVGTWRDVNLGMTPTEIIDNESVVELGPSDYDDGFIGRYPPSREEP